MKKLSDRQIYERSISEDDIVSAIRGLLEYNGFRVFRLVERIPWGKRTSEPGLPDLMGYFKWAHKCAENVKGFSMFDRPFYIEVKKPGGAHRPAQERWIAQARADGVIAFFASSVEEMVKGFAEYGIRLKGV